MVRIGRRVISRQLRYFQNKRHFLKRVPVVGLLHVTQIIKRRTINALQMGVKTLATYRTLKYFRRKFPPFTVYIRRSQFGFGVEA